MSLGKARRRALVGAGLAACAAAAPVVYFRGFTVDDALIPARIAFHLARGLGHRFNPGGAPVDAVTPFGWAHFLALAARRSPVSALHFAKWFGALAWIAAAAWLGGSVARETTRARPVLLLLVLATCMPLSMWAAAGMETGVVIALAALAVTARSDRPALAGLAAAMRPELLPWSIVLSVGGAGVSGSGRTGVLSALAVAALPACGVALLRFIVYGSPVPLAVWAKPSDLDHGLFYVAASLLWTGVPALLVAPRALRRLEAGDRVVLAAAAVHCVALVLAGGDWMPSFRLFVPMLPGLLYVGARLADVSPVWATVPRVAVAVSLSLLLIRDKGEATRGVGEQRARLIAEAGPVLSGARRVAALDVGWVGAATPADVVDLAGLTDPSVARLPGGHTSKHLPPRFLESRAVDTLVLLADGAVPPDFTRAHWAREVELRIASEAERLGFVPLATLELRGTPLRYVVLRLKKDS